MAITVVQTATAYDPASGTCSFPNNTTAGNCIVVVIFTYALSSQTITTTGCTIGGSADHFQQAVAVQTTPVSGDTDYLAAWVDPNCAGGQKTVVANVTNATWQGQYTGTGLIIYELAGVALSSPVDRTSASAPGATGTQANSGTTAGTSAANEMAIGAAIPAATFTGFDSTYTNITMGSPVSCVAGYMQVPAVNTTVNYTATANENNVVGAIVFTLLANQGTSSPPNITTTSLPGAVTGTAYSQPLTAAGGITPYTWSLASGSLPAGLSLSPSGVISGTPSATSGVSGFTVQVTDAASNTDTQALSISINAAATWAGVMVAVTPAAAASPLVSPALEMSGFAIAGPDSNDIINSVTVAVTEHQSSASAGPCTFQLWDYSVFPAAQIGAARSGTVSTLSSNTSTATFTGVTYPQLATLRVRVYGTSVPGYGLLVDSASITVNYTPVASAYTAALSGRGDLTAAGWAGIALLTGSGTLAATPVTAQAEAAGLSGAGTLAGTAVTGATPPSALGVYRGPCGVYAQDGNSSGGAQSGIAAYQTWLEASITYVLDYITSTPVTWDQFTGAYLYKAIRNYTTLPGWGTLPPGQVMMLGIPACCGATTGSGGDTWAGEAAGLNDAYWATLGANLVSWGYGNAVLRIGREFNYPGYSWSPSTTGDTPAQYIAGYQHIVTLLRAVPGNSFTFMWNPALSPGSMSGQAGNAADTQTWYPGSAYADVIGLDVYDWGNYPEQTAAPWGGRTLSQQTANWSYLQGQQDGLSSWAAFAAASGVRLAYPEWGLQLWLSGGGYYGGGDDPYYIQQMRQVVAGSLMNAMWEDLGMGLFDTDAYPGRTAGLAPDLSRGVYLTLFTGLAAVLAGTGTLSGRRTVTWRASDGLSGTGTIFTLATGGLVFGTSIATPYAYPLSSQVMVAPPGSKSWVPLGSIGVVTELTYSFTCPGGCDQMTAAIMVPATYRTQLFNPGWQVRITRGGHQVWDGKLDEPVPTTSGWTLTASGTGTRGTDFLAVWNTTPWPAGQPDDIINEAVSRGLNWVNPGIGTPPGAWFGQQVDSGAQTVTAMLNLICTRGGLTWYVNSQPGGVTGDDLNVFPLPATPTRLLSSVNPAPRTLGGDINNILIRYMISADGTDSSGNQVAATYGTEWVQNPQSTAAHGEMETFIDLSDAGVMTAAAVASVGFNVLAIYQLASFAGPFTASYGQLMTTTGVPVDPGTDQAGTVVKLVLSDFGYGGEVTPQFPITFLVGAYEWDDRAQTATLTPYQNVDSSLQGLLSLANTELTPITVASS